MSVVYAIVLNRATEATYLLSSQNSDSTFLNGLPGLWRMIISEHGQGAMRSVVEAKNLMDCDSRKKKRKGCYQEWRRSKLQHWTKFQNPTYLPIFEKISSRNRNPGFSALTGDIDGQRQIPLLPLDSPTDGAILKTEVTIWRNSEDTYFHGVVLTSLRGKKNDEWQSIIFWQKKTDPTVW